MTRVEEMLKEKARYNAFFEKHIEAAYVRACVDYVELQDDVSSQLMNVAEDDVKKLYEQHLADLKKRALSRAAKKAKKEDNTI